MLKDRILAGTIAGMIAALAKDVPNLILWKLGIVKYSYFTIAASSLLRPQDTTSILGWVLGIIVDIITGGTLGIVIIFLFKLTGRDYWWYKGLIAGNLIWLLGLGILINIGFARIIPIDPIFRITSLFEHQVFGLTAAYLIFTWYPTGDRTKLYSSRRFGEGNRLVPSPARKKRLK
ncbi:MAG: hypothetical protein WC854_14140 [Bacteroidales bacterium]